MKFDKKFVVENFWVLVIGFLGLLMFIGFDLPDKEVIGLGLMAWTALMVFGGKKK